MSDDTLALRDLVAISRYAGNDVLLVQGGGGNTSVKAADGRRMWIKASGGRLLDLTETAGYLAVELPALLAIARDPALSILPRAAAHEESVRRVQATAIDAGTLRPSLETGFHALLGRVVLHTHPVYVNAFACMEGGRAALEEILADFPIWVDYAAPGYELCLRVDQKTQNVQQSRHQPAAVVLANHGLIASGATADEVIDLTRNHVAAGEKFFGPLPLEATSQVDPKPAARTWANRLEKSWRNAGWKGVAQPARYAVLQDTERLPPMMGALVPDDVVNGCHDIPEVAEDSDPTEGLMGQGRGDRRIVRVHGLGFVLAGPNEKAVAGMEENLLANVLIHALIARRGQPRRLPDAEIDYLRNMESEKYRQAIAAGSVYQAETKSCRS